MITSHLKAFLNSKIKNINLFYREISGSPFDIFCAPLRLNFDEEKIGNEVLQYLPQFYTGGTYKSWIQNKRCATGICEETELEKITHWKINEDGSRSTVKGEIPSHSVINLKYLPAHPRSKSGGLDHRFDTDLLWEWNPDFNIPYIKKLVSELPFEKVDIVRVLYLPKGGISPLHLDVFDSSYWKKHRCLGINIQILDGGSPLVVTFKKKQYQVSDRAFIFRDDIPHGVPRVSGDRITLRILGKPKIAEFKRIVKETEFYYNSMDFKYLKLI